MSPSEEIASQTSVEAKSLVPPEFLLSLATAPVLLALVGSKVLTEAIRELGVFSEEIFRGDRLPVLHFPNRTDPHPDDRPSL